MADDYIRQNDIEKPFEKKDRGGGGKSSKFDRYNRDNGNVQFNDADADEYDEPMDDDDGNSKWYGKVNFVIFWN